MGSRILFLTVQLILMWVHVSSFRRMSCDLILSSVWQKSLARGGGGNSKPGMQKSERLGGGGGEQIPFSSHPQFSDREVELSLLTFIPLGACIAVGQTDRDRKPARQRQTERHPERDRDRKTARERVRQRQRQQESQRSREKKTGRQRQKDSQRERERERQLLTSFPLFD